MIFFKAIFGSGLLKPETPVPLQYSWSLFN